MLSYDLIIAACAGILAACAALWWMTRSGLGQTAAAGPLNESHAISFLFHDDYLVDASPDGERLLQNEGADSSFAGVLALFTGRFDCSCLELDPPSGDQHAICPPLDPADPMRLVVSAHDQTRRIDLASDPTRDCTQTNDMYQIMAELETQKKANALTPCPIWQTDANGQVVWSNIAYDQLHERLVGEDGDRKTPLFDLSDTPVLPARLSLSEPGTPHPFWFNVTETRHDGGSFYVATDSNAVVNAETAQRTFVQTLAKTFAHLSTGLAIFNDERQLILFNPALVDLTELNAEFLSARPYLLSFFDELRNKRTMPEPKNYNSWRQQIADLVAAASDGRYSEIWSLENGRTYRVNGRPHPDGAIAFLFEDISAEVSSTRRFRAELELSQSVIDSLESAIVVFSSSGILTISNNKYAELWHVDPERSFADVTIIDAMRDWQANSAPSPIWGELRDFVLDFQDRASWFARVPGPDGEMLDCDVVPLTSGATMVKFKTSQLTLHPKLAADQTPDN